MLSVIISTRNDERGTVATLAALVPGATAGLIADVVLLDIVGGEAIQHIADVAGCELLIASGDDGATGEGLRQAVQKTRSPWLLFLQAGAVLQQGWIEETMEFVESSAADDNSRGAVFRYARSHYGQRTAGDLGRTFWRWLRGTSPDRGLLISRPHYERLGG